MAYSPPPPAPPAHPSSSRWKSGPTTFGPLGRIVATLMLLVPVWFFWANPVGWICLAIWLIFVMPLALRDIWKPTHG